MRRLAGLVLALGFASACGVHSNAECTDRIPCPAGMECSPDGICVLILPADASVDGPIAIDAPDAGFCGDRACLGDETCVTCRDDCGDCPFRCGDGACESGLGEDCMVCPADCGPCPDTCGDGVCSSDESCRACPIDCGTCPGCEHGPCQIGGPLDPGCEPCVGTVCSFDPFCCMGAWDEICAQEAAFLCPGRCEGRCGDGLCAPDGTESCETCPIDCGMCGECAHPLCTTGGPLEASCDPCVTLICSVDPFCCAGAWDDVCRAQVTSLCGIPCGMMACGDGACDPFAGETCTSCSVDCGPCGACGDGMCGPTESTCTCPVDCGDCACAHGLCEPGSRLEPMCDECVSLVCLFDPFCCENAWDDTCVQEVGFLCGLPCGGGFCGDFTCDPGSGESCLNCPSDCGMCPPSCGDMICNALLGETCTSCPIDCGMCGACVDQDLAGPLPLTATGTTVGRGNDHTMAPCGDGGASAPDVVLRWTAPAAGSYRFSTLGSAFDTILYARAIDCTGPVLACNDDDPSGGLHSIFELSLAAGQTIVLVLDGWGGGQGTYVLRIEAVMGGMGCGNGVCTAMESCATCPVDCGPCGFCGDFICDPAAGERCDTCPTDCGMCAMCGDGFCDAWAGETCTTCTIDCGPCPPVCGNGSCDPGEGCLTCPGDCGVCPGTCGNGVCGPGETCASCAVDCGTCGGTCTHDVCLEGPPLVSGCSPCVTQVCAFDPFCCTAQWDGLCAEEAAMVCGEPCARACGDGACGRGESCASCPGDCGACPCPHDVCTEGAPMAASCSPCVGQVCAVDPFCCSTTWDDRCIAEAQTLCGISCGGVCGDLSCGPGESCATCPTDCGPCTVCGDGACTGGETCMTCDRDCGPCGGFCGDLICDPFVGEFCDTCPIDCGPCGGLCGDFVCDMAAGERCDTCPMDCGPCGDVCGDGACTGGEFCFSCEPDCGGCLSQCGDMICNAQQLEFCFSCPADCPCP